MQEEKQKEHYFCISSSMTKRLLFWVIYFLSIIIIYLYMDTRTSTKSEIGIKQSTIYLIKQFEGIKHTAYDDGYGNMTIGIGHYIKPNEEKLYYTTLSTKQAHKLLERDMEPCKRVMDDKVGSPLNQHQFDALMSLCYNIGPDKFAGSEVIKHINRQNYNKAADAMMNWNRPQELTKRRQKERQLFLKGA